MMIYNIYTLFVQPLGAKAGTKSNKVSQEKAKGQPRKGTRAAKKRHKGSQEKAQGQARKGTRAGKSTRLPRQRVPRARQTILEGEQPRRGEY